MPRDACLRVEQLRVIAYERGFSPRQLARELQISPRQLQRLFRRDFGCTPTEWLREERLQLARSLLLASRRVKQVAYTLSYGHPSQFTRDFRNRFLITPSALIRSAVPAKIAALQWPVP